MNKKYIDYTFSIFIALVFVLGIELNVDINEVDLSYMVLRFFSYTFIPHEGNLIEFIYSLAHYIFTIYVFSRFISIEIKEKAIYIFTRTSKRSLWILKKYIKLFKEVVLYYLVNFTFIICVSFLMGFKILDFNVLIKLILIEFVMTILSMYLLVLVVNTFSLYYEDVIAFVYTVICFIGNSILLRLFIEDGKLSFIKWSLFTKHLISLTDIKGFNRNIDEFSLYLAGHSLYFDFIFLVLAILCILIISSIKIKKIEFV